MDTCPFCGATEFLAEVKTELKVFDCETELRNKGELDEWFYRGKPCLKAQISQLQAQVADLEKRLEAWRIGKVCFVMSPRERREWFDKLRNLGEI